MTSRPLRNYDGQTDRRTDRIIGNKNIWKSEAKDIIVIQIVRPSDMYITQLAGAIIAPLKGRIYAKNTKHLEKKKID